MTAQQDTPLNKKSSFELTSAQLHIIAMTAMFLDHAWLILPYGPEWMTCVGRITFPIYAFMIVEGFYHTRSVKGYMKRLFVWALISEIPYNLMVGSSVVYPFQQNVLWTFLIALIAISVIDKARRKGSAVRTVMTAALVLPVASLMGLLSMSDYGNGGVLMVLLFYILRGDSFFHRAAQTAAMWWVNTEVLSGLYYVVTLFGREVEITRQSFALFALIPIWLYKGKQGRNSVALRRFRYAYYPLHILLLVFARRLMGF